MAALAEAKILPLRLMIRGTLQSQSPEHTIQM